MTQPAQAFTKDERQAYIGASEIAAVMAVDRWRTPLQVFQEKTGLTEPFEGNAHTERGNRLEAIAAEEFTRITGHELRRRSQAYSHPDYPFIVGHIDRIFVGAKHLAEIKCPSIAAYRKFQREGLPESMIVQMQVYLGLTGCEKGTWIVFCADAWQVSAFDVDFDPTLYAIAIHAAVEFWTNHILTGVAPEIEDQKTYEIEKGVSTVTRRDDEPFIAKSAALREAIELKRDAEELFEATKKDFIATVEDAPGIYEAPGLRVHYSLRAGRTSFDKKGLAKAYPDIELSRFEKTGSPFKEFRPYLLKGENQ